MGGELKVAMSMYLASVNATEIGDSRQYAFLTHTKTYYMTGALRRDSHTVTGATEWTASACQHVSKSTAMCSLSSGNPTPYMAPRSRKSREILVFSVIFR